MNNSLALRQPANYPFMQVPISREVAETCWQSTYFEPSEFLRRFPTYDTIWGVTSEHRHGISQPRDRVNDPSNVTEAMCRQEWNQISPETFQKLNALRTLTGEKLKRLLKDIFQEEPIKKDSHYRISGYFISEQRYLPVYWVSDQSRHWGEDIPSLWAQRYQRGYVYAIHYIFDRLGEHEITNEFRHDNKKGYWKPELTPLALDIHAPWCFYSPWLIGGARFFNYFRNGILVGCSCSISHPDYRELNTFFSLMRHSLTRDLRWFPIYPPPETGLFYNDDKQGWLESDVLFMPDEDSVFAFEEDQLGYEKGFIVPPVPLACPGGLKRLPDANVFMTSGKRVHIVVPQNLQGDTSLLSALAKAFSTAGAESLSFYHPTGFDYTFLATTQAFQKFDFAAEKSKGASVAMRTVTMPGEKIPGSEIKRRAVLHPLIKSGQLVWIYGPEKSGKSWLARSIAHVISYGSKFLGKYQATPGLKVLYIDSEYSPDELELMSDKELAGLGFSSGRQFAVKSAKAADNPSGVINLLEPKWQEWFNDVAPEYDVTFIDCYYSLTGSSVMPYGLLKLLRPWIAKDKTFIVIDHTNKEGDLQGGLDKKRAADLCVEVKPDDDDHYCVEISFPTVRYLGPEDTQPFTLYKVFEDDSFRFELEDAEPNPGLTLSEAELRAALAFAWIELKSLKPAELAEHIGRGQSTVYGWVQKMKEELNRKGGPSKKYDALLEQVRQYEDFTEAKLIEEARHLAKT
jgi:hypothetical protein